METTTADVTDEFLAIFSDVLTNVIALCGGLKKADALFSKEMLKKLQQYVADYQTHGSPKVLAIAFHRMYLPTKNNDSWKRLAVI